MSDEDRTFLAGLYRGHPDSPANGQQDDVSRPALGPWRAVKYPGQHWQVRNGFGERLAEGNTKDVTALLAAAPDLAAALKAMTERYVSLAGSGDCGCWDPEAEPEVQAARAALAKARGES